jgi:hypothetical protein
VSKTLTKPKRKAKPKKIRRSGFEDKVELLLKETDTKYVYEPFKLPYVLPQPVQNYTPDFAIGNMIIEVKGYLPYKDQIKMIAVKQAHPHLDIRFVFYDPNKKLPRRKMTHAEWADKHNYPWYSFKDFVELITNGK